jgi:tetratricopeptide (TPR) repeat protein
VLDAAPAMKLIAAIATSPAKRRLRKLTFRRRVARAAIAKARDQHIDVTVRGIAGWLRRPDTRQMLEGGRGDLMQSVLANLELRVGGNNRRVDAERLLPIVLRQTTLALETNEALANVESRISAQIDSATEATRATVIVAFSAKNTFEQNLRRLHPWRAADAATVRSSWPGIVDVAQALAQATDVAAALEEWATTGPRLIDGAGAEGYAWLGHVAADYKAAHAAVHYFGEAIEHGASPRGYFLARAALAIEGVEDEKSRLLLASAGSSDPLSRSLTLLSDGAEATALQSLTDWTPTAPHDRALRAILIARVHFFLDQEDQALDVLVQAAAADPEASGPALAAAIGLARRARFGVAATPYRDLDQAYRLAIQARNARRAWGGDSAPAVVVAVTAIALYGDLARALQLVTAQPDGEATPAEAAADEVRQERAVLLATTAPIEVARSAITDLVDPHAVALASGILALRESGGAMGAQLLLDAYAFADDDDDRLRVAHLLAEHCDELPDVAGLEERHPEIVRELRTLRTILAPGPDRVTRLRTHQHEYPQVAVALAESYSAQEMIEEAASVLASAGVAFSLPSLLVAAANMYLELGDSAEAVRQCEAAIAMAGSGWPGEFRARVCMFNAMSADGQTDDALQQARALVGIDPTDASAMWALARTYVQLGDIKSAWAALTLPGEPIDPRSATEARLWIQLVVRSPRAASLISRVLDVARTWSDHADVSAAFVMSMATLFPVDGLDEADIAAIQAVSSELLAKHAESTHLQSIAAGPDDDPLVNIRPVLKRRHDSLASLQAQVSQGELPVGMLALATSTVSEVLLHRYAGKVYGYTEQDAATRANVAATALDGRCVLDVTAAATLALLDQATTDDLQARFSELISTHEALHDALAAQTSLRIHSTLTVGWDPTTEQPRLTEISEEQAVTLSSRADRLVALLRRTRRRAYPRLKTFSALDERDGTRVWLGLLDMAADLGLPLWCDDMVLAQLASSVGVPLFGTVDLLRHLRRTGQVQPELADIAESQLLHNYFVDLGFSRDIAVHAAEIAGWGIEGAAFSLTRSQAWLDSESAMRFLEAAITRAGSPEVLQAWVSAAAIGLTADLSPAAGSSNLHVLLGRLLAHPSVRPEHVPMVLDGIRTPVTQNPELSDPLEETLREINARLIAKYGYRAAQVLLLGLVAWATEADKAIAARVVLTAD